MTIETKLVKGIERLSEVLKSQLWIKAKKHGLSPIQIQILFFVSTHHIDLCNVSYLAKHLHVTKATISDAVKVLVAKGILIKDHSPIDQRRYNLHISESTSKFLPDAELYAQPLLDYFERLPKDQKIDLYGHLFKLINHLLEAGAIQVQRTYNALVLNANIIMVTRNHNTTANFLIKNLK